MRNDDRRSTAERQRERYGCYREAFLDIKAQLVVGKDLREVSERTAERCDVELRTAYEWVLDCQKRLERNRKRISISALILLWAAFGLAVIAGVLWLTGAAPSAFAGVEVSAALMAAVSAGALAAIGITIILAARRLGARATGPL